MKLQEHVLELSDNEFDIEGFFSSKQESIFSYLE
jgi:hypothetical protein